MFAWSGPPAPQPNVAPIYSGLDQEDQGKGVAASSSALPGRPSQISRCPLRNTLVGTSVATQHRGRATNEKTQRDLMSGERRTSDATPSFPRLVALRRKGGRSTTGWGYLKRPFFEIRSLGPPWPHSIAEGPQRENERTGEDSVSE